MDGEIGVLDGVEEALKKEVAIVAWRLYKEHEDMEIITIRKWFIQKTFYLHDLKSVFELLFGSEPA